MSSQCLRETASRSLVQLPLEGSKGLVVEVPRHRRHEGVEAFSTPKSWDHDLAGVPLQKL